MKCNSILIVEDDLNIQAAIKEALEFEGYSEVYTANNGKEALELLKKLSIPCVILLDVMMPIMDGWEFLRIVRESSPDNAIATIPVVVVSASVAAEKMALEKGAEGFVKKPVDLDALFKTVRLYCE